MVVSGRVACILQGMKADLDDIWDELREQRIDALLMRAADLCPGCAQNQELGREPLRQCGCPCAARHVWVRLNHLRGVSD